MEGMQTIKLYWYAVLPDASDALFVREKTRLVITSKVTRRDSFLDVVQNKGVKINCKQPQLAADAVWVSVCFGRLWKSYKFLRLRVSNKFNSMPVSVRDVQYVHVAMTRLGFIPTVQHRPPVLSSDNEDVNHFRTCSLFLHKHKRNTSVTLN